MGHSSLLGVDPASREPRGRDSGTLGPSDSSDTGSDFVGVPEEPEDAQPADISVDHVVSAGGTVENPRLHDDEDPDLAFVDDAQAGDLLDEEATDPEALDEREREELVDASTAAPHPPARQPVEPDQTDEPRDHDDDPSDDPPDDEGDVE